ncbi:MAG TPA: UPF0182 family protein, partial [Longimicrobiales bacterium]|nr:UPF0182 family protein [Longimicrobiales bacterium]
MTDFPGPDLPRGERRPINLTDLDVTRLNRLIGWGVWLVAIFLLWLAAGWAHSFYTDWLWFTSVGHESVLLTTTIARVVLYLGGLIVFLALAIPNLHYARRATDATPALAAGLTSTSYRVVRKLLLRGAAGAAILFALLLAAHPAAEWETALMYLHRVPFGEAEPIFNRDFGFFVFTLPALDLVRVWLLSALFAIGLIVSGFYYLTSRTRSDHFAYLRQARLHLALLGAALFVVIAAGHWL